MKGGKSSGRVPLPTARLARVDNPERRAHFAGMASSDRVQRALAAASELSAEEREELIAELVLSLGRDREPEPSYDEAGPAEVRRRVDPVASHKSQGLPR
jgi:hypothetical protein